MSDFLTRIAQLGRGEARVIEPRLPSLFAPPADYDMPIAADTIQTTVHPVDKEVVNEKTKQAPLVNAVYVETAHPKPSAEPLPQTDQYQEIVKGHADKMADAPTPVVVPQENNASEPLIVAPLPDNGQGHPAAATQEESGRNRASLSQEEKLQTIVPAHIKIPFEVVVDKNGQPGSLIPQSPLQLVPDYKTQYATPPQIIAKLPDSSEIAAQQETAVHINIGRVEVRAQPAAPISKPRPAQAKGESNLSLQEYLKRSGGRP